MNEAGGGFQHLPYLHAYATNTAAIGLYEAIGFKLRRTMNGAVVQRSA